MSWHLITCEYPPDVGGISDHTAQLASGLAAAGDEVHVYCPGDERPASGAVHVHAGARRVSRLRTCGGPISRSMRARARGAWSSSGCRTASGGGRSTWASASGWRVAPVRAICVDVVVHEPYLDFGWGPLRHLAMAVVHRLMTAVLLRAADRVWISTPAWESRLRPYALGPRHRDAVAARARLRDHRERRPPTASRLSPPWAGRWSAISAPTATAVAALLEERLAGVMEGASRPALLLLGAGGEAFATRLLGRHPQWRGRVHAPGYLSPDLLDAHLTACDVLMQPYPDGITVRRTSAMAALARGRAVVTTTGHLTEPLWADQRRGGAGGRGRCRPLHRRSRTAARRRRPRAGTWKHGRAPPTTRTFPWIA